MTTAMVPHAMPAIFPARDEARGYGGGVPPDEIPVEVALAADADSAEGSFDVEDIEEGLNGELDALCTEDVPEKVPVMLENGGDDVL